MPTPLTHTMFGLILYRVSVRPGNILQRTLKLDTETGTIWPYVFAATIADIDLVAGMLKGDPDVFHRGVTHTLAAAVVFATALALIATRNGAGVREALNRWIFLSSCYMGHLVLDFFQRDITVSNGMGVPLLFPFIHHTLISPVKIFFFTKSSPDCTGLFGCFFIPVNFLAVGWEIILMVVLARIILGGNGFKELGKPGSWKIRGTSPE